MAFILPSTTERSALQDWGAAIAVKQLKEGP